MSTALLTSHNIDRVDLRDQSCHSALSSGCHANIIQCEWHPQELDSVEALAHPYGPQEKGRPFLLS